MAQRVGRLANLNSVIARNDKVVTIFGNLWDELSRFNQFVVFLSFERSKNKWAMESVVLARCLTSGFRATVAGAFQKYFIYWVKVP